MAERVLCIVSSQGVAELNPTPCENYDPVLMMLDQGLHGAPSVVLHGFTAGMASLHDLWAVLPLSSFRHVQHCWHCVSLPLTTCSDQVL